MIAALSTVLASTVACGDDGGGSAGDGNGTTAWCEAYEAVARIPALSPNEPETWVEVVDAAVTAHQQLGDVDISGEGSGAVSEAADDLVDLYIDLRQRLVDQGSSSDVLSAFYAESSERLEEANSQVDAFVSQACAEEPPADHEEPTQGTREQDWDCLVNPSDC